VAQLPARVPPLPFEVPGAGWTVHTLPDYAHGSGGSAVVVATVSASGTVYTPWYTLDEPIIVPIRPVATGGAILATCVSVESPRYVTAQRKTGTATATTLSGQIGLAEDDEVNRYGMYLHGLSAGDGTYIQVLEPHARFLFMILSQSTTVERRISKVRFGINIGFSGTGTWELSFNWQNETNWTKFKILNHGTYPMSSFLDA